MAGVFYEGIVLNENEHKINDLVLIGRISLGARVVARRLIFLKGQSF
jgi:hypothetical protein